MISTTLIKGSRLSKIKVININKKVAFTGNNLQFGPYALKMSL
jgi:hypothetical protein